ncbi:hypothetical protein IAT40_001067 [Kwoniella sp. CBS 6097]
MARETPLLGLSERWSLARNNIGSPITVIYHTSLPVNLLSETDLQNALVRLCEAYPILLYGVSGKNTNRPFYSKNGEIDPRGMVKVVEVEAGETMDLTELVQKAVKRGAEFDVINGPMLEVQYIYPSFPTTATTTTASVPDSDPTSGSAHAAGAGSRAQLILIIDHILCDGVGARNLFADLLSILSDESASLPAQPDGLPARMDDTVDLRTQPQSQVDAGNAIESSSAEKQEDTKMKDSSYLGKVYSQVGSLVKSVLPQTTPQATATSTATQTQAKSGTENKTKPDVLALSYPPKPSPKYNSILAPQQFDQFEISSSELSGLLSMSKNHHVGTVHPTIHIASLIALYRAHLQAGAQTLDGDRIKFTTSIPISERKEMAELGHPRSAGNYVIFHLSTDTVDPTTPFWEQARSFARGLRNPENRQTARYNLGKLADIEAEGEISPAPEKKRSEIAGEEASPSKWEDYLLGMVNDTLGPHKLSLAVSNVGIMELPKSGRLAGPGVVGDVYFTQAASAMGACVVLSIMSTRGGSFTVSFSSKKGSLPAGVFEHFVPQLKGILQAISRGDVSEDAIASSAVAGVPAPTPTIECRDE